MNNNFVVFILSNGRPDDVQTVTTLRRCGYTGKYYIVVDDEDSTYDRYVSNFGKDTVLLFSKKDISESIDSMDLSKDMRTVVYARQACFRLAEELGVTYFLELDDDYKDFQHRTASGNKLLVTKVRDLDAIFQAMLDFLECDDRILCTAFAQGGDFIGGVYGSKFQKGCLRKSMNTLFMSTKKKFNFIGRINEDVNTYTSLSSKGYLFLTPTCIMTQQRNTQKGSGGMSSVYLDSGTYLKSFYSVMIQPSSVKIAPIITPQSWRIHHYVRWDYCAPMIISDMYKK
jgi:hypothetical protein